MPRCFRGLRDPSRPANVHYFSNPKSWMTSDVMLVVLKRFNRKLLFKQRKAILFLDNATCHPESIVDSFSQMKIMFLPKNTTSRPQPLDANIIQNFNVKYGKGWLSMHSQEPIKTLLQHESLRCKDADDHSMGTKSMEGGNREDNEKLF